MTAIRYADHNSFVLGCLFWGVVSTVIQYYFLQGNWYRYNLLWYLRSGVTMRNNGSYFYSLKESSMWTHRNKSSHRTVFAMRVLPCSKVQCVHLWQKYEGNSRILELRLVNNCKGPWVISSDLVLGFYDLVTHLNTRHMLLISYNKDMRDPLFCFRQMFSTLSGLFK